LSNHEGGPWVAGFYSQCVTGPDKSYVWTGDPNQPIQPLTFPGANVQWSYAYDVTDTGLVVGAFAPNNGAWRGFIYEVATGAWTQLNPIVSGGTCIVRAANNSGTVVGSRTISDTAYNAFIWHNGVYTDLGVMNGPHSEARDVSHSGKAVGWCGSTSSSNNARAFIADESGITLVQPWDNLLSTAGIYISDTGIVGLHCRIPNPAGGAFARGAVWINGDGTLLEPAKGYRTSFVGAANSTALVVGSSGSPLTGGTTFVATLWRNLIPSNLNELCSSEIHLISGIDMNDRGEILCEGLADDASQVAVILIPVYSALGDINSDCQVNVADLLTVIAEWGKSKSLADLNQDNIVDVQDLLIVIKNWTFQI
jgi:probable HAF family extracellular repeat protein